MGVHVSEPNQLPSSPSLVAVSKWITVNAKYCSAKAGYYIVGISRSAISDINVGILITSPISLRLRHSRGVGRDKCSYFLKNLKIPS